MGPREPDWDEDGCLNLNVWTPADALPDATPRPVLVWFHGGGFTSGSGGWDWYDGRNLAAAGNIVVVTANYRLGPLGYLRLPAIGADNLGCQDQAAVLRWTRDNIAAFGGDPAQVTVGGQSGGAYSALLLAVDPATSGLVHRVIAQSGPWGLAPQQPEAADEAASRYLALLGIGSGDGAIEALRQVPAADLLSAYGTLAARFPQPASAAPPMWPVLGGAGVPLRWQDGLAGATARQILIGRTEDEMTAFPAAAAAHPDGIGAATEELFGAGVTQIAEACAAHGTLVYRFARDSADDPALGATHCSDLPFAFDNLGAYSRAPMLGPVSDTDRALGHSLSTALARFAAAGLAGDPDWPAYRPGEGRHIRRFGS